MMTEKLSRRALLQTAGTTLAAAALTPSVRAQAPAPAAAPPKEPLPKLSAPTERESASIPEPVPPDSRVGWALVGLGRLTIEELLPAFAQCRLSKPVALVSGDRAKAERLASEHGIDVKNLYDYKTYDQLRDNPAVQVIYVVLPNGMHAEYTTRGFAAGKHVFCEKPMANTVKEAESMIDAGKKAGKTLAIAYRQQYEPYNRELIRMTRAKEFGPVKIIHADNGQNQGDPNQWRLKKSLAGGGAMPDVGIYCLNAARFLTGEEPTEIAAMQYSTPGDPRFTEVEETVLFHLRFPSGIVAHCSTSYGVHQTKRLNLLADGANYGLEPAFVYNGLRMRVAHKVGNAESVETRTLEEKNQFALEMDAFSECVLTGRMPLTPGEEGLQDMKLMAAIYEAARTGRTIKLPPVAGLDAFRGPVPAILKEN